MGPLIACALILLIGGGILCFLSTARINFYLKNGKASISAPLYSCTFDLSSVCGLQILPFLPSGIRTNGLELGFLRAGSFTLEGIGPCRVYAYAKSNPVLLIQLENENILLSGRTSEETERWRQELLRSD